MNTIDSDRPADEQQSNRKPPPINPLQDLTLVEAWDSERNTPKYVTLYLITKDEEVYFGQSLKNKREITFAEYNAAL